MLQLPIQFCSFGKMSTVNIGRMLAKYNNLYYILDHQFYFGNEEEQIPRTPVQLYST